MAGLLLHALQDTEITVFYQDHDLRYVWIENVPEGWTREAIIGRFDTDILPPAEAREVKGYKAHVLETGEACHHEMQVHTPHGARWFDLWMYCDRAGEGDAAGVLTFAVETTEKKRKEASLRELLAEVTHRSRNLLAVVQAIANQSFGAEQGPQALARFQERLQSLSISLDIITTEGWDGARLRELVERQVAPYAERGARFEVSGEDRMLLPNAAIHVGLAVQELAADMRGGNARVELRSETNGTGATGEGAAHASRDPLVLHWDHEQTGPSVRAPMARRTLERIVPAAIQGDAVLDCDERRLHYRLSIPRSNFEG